MKRIAAAVPIAIALVFGASHGALAADRGNHEAIWKANQHLTFVAEEPCDGLAVADGSDWGGLVGCMASDDQLKPSGVSEGVHLAKDQPVPGQSR